MTHHGHDADGHAVLPRTKQMRTAHPGRRLCVLTACLRHVHMRMHKACAEGITLRRDDAHVVVAQEQFGAELVVIAAGNLVCHSLWGERRGEG